MSTVSDAMLSSPKCELCITHAQAVNAFGVGSRIVWPLKLDVKRKLLARSDRVKCVDLHPSEPWMLASLYNGNIHVWNYEIPLLIKSFEICDLPVRAAKFVPRKNWIISGSDDMQVRVFNYNTLDRVHILEAHSDYIRSIVVHPTQPFVLTSSDDMLIKLWNWEKNWTCTQVFEGHTHYVMQIVINPKDNNTFASASLDRTVKVWQLGSSSANFTLDGHEKGVNCVDYYHGGEKPYLISGADDRLVKIWDYQIGSCCAIFGGHMLGVKSISGLAFYDWETLDLVRRIEIQPKNIYWSESGELVSIATDETFYILRYNSEAVMKVKHFKTPIPEDGIEQAFEVLGMHVETVKTGLWVGDCFIYTNTLNRLNYYVGGEIVTIAHLDRVMYLLGYIPKDSRLYLGDKELNIVSYSLLLSVLEYQTAVMRGDFETAHSVLPSVPWEQRTRVAHFLEKQASFKISQLVVSMTRSKFDLGPFSVGDLALHFDLAKDAMNEQKWKQLAELALTKCEFKLAEECLQHAKDFGGLLLLATSSGNANIIKKLGESSEAAGINNVAFISYFLLGKKEKALNMLVQTGRLPEAAFFARTYLPSQVSRIVKLWKENLKKVNEKASLALADPEDYENLFPGLNSAIKAEQFMEQNQICQPASSYLHVTSGADISGFVGQYASPKVPECVENVPAKQLANEKVVVCDKNTDIPVAKPVQHEAAISDLNIDEELELDIKNLILDENIENDIYFEEDLLSED
ncbi:Coatomer subunit beta' like protein [Argiope bruennichi]|uniref:Beta'-coat protein n=1 Tax=Argiope bruennichi TaxID=94029 RepID=A0A8T0FPJ4_ARGBR|nr:Coatomer subunit beta' like protein [Argiope bruennichi]